MLDTELVYNKTCYNVYFFLHVADFIVTGGKTMEFTYLVVYHNLNYIHILIWFVHLLFKYIFFKRFLFFDMDHFKSLF